MMNTGGVPAEVAAGVREGDVLAGKYRVERVLGVGGMGVVVAAHHLQLDERVAIKFMLPEALTDSEAVGRFAREARAAVKIKSEHVARVTDVGTLDTGAPYMVMEYLEGWDLSAWLQQHGGLPVEQAVEFVVQACDAIADAHSLGIIHRDLKPANLVCIQRNDGLLSIKVLDFGISKMTGLGNSEPDMGMTKTASMMGSPFYMSPEQLQSARDVDTRTDIWALGVILYELLAGRVPFGGETIAEVVLKIMSAPVPSFRDVRPDVPDGLVAVIQRCLEKDRARRFPNIAELAVALTEFGPERARVSVERITRVIQAAGMSTGSLTLPPLVEAAARTFAPLGRTTTGTRGRRTTLFGIGIGVAAAVLIAVVALVIGRRAPTADDATRSLPAASPIASATTQHPATPLPPFAASESPPVTSQAAEAPSAAVDSQAGVGAAPVLGAQPHGPKKDLRTKPTPSAAAKPESTPKPTAPKPNCDPNFYLDAQGEKHFKPECF